LNKAKTALVKQCVWEFGPEGINPMVLIADADENGWNKISENEASVDFLPTEELLSMIDSGTVPNELTQNVSRWTVHTSLNLSAPLTQSMIFVTWDGSPVVFTMRLSQRKKKVKIFSTFFLTELGVAKSKFGLKAMFPMMHQAEILRKIPIGWEAPSRLTMALCTLSMMKMFQLMILIRVTAGSKQGQ
jgi:hypothetical protein